MSTKKVTEKHYDLILIGSGMGALTVASLMAQLRHKKILVLERDFKSGGLTHDLKRQHFHWDTDVHDIGMMGKTQIERALMDLVTGGKVQWTQLSDPVGVFVYPDFRFPVYGNRKRYQDELICRFPEETAAIRQYFRDLANTYQHGYPAHTRQQCRTFPTPLIGKLTGTVYRSWVRWTVKDYLNSHFQNPELKAIVASQWGEMGLSPNLCSFSIFATMMNSYMEGIYYPLGGTGTIANSVQQIVEAEGGKFLLNREVARVLLKDNRAIGVRVRKVHANSGTVEDYFAPVIVSDAGAAATYLNLIPSHYPIPFRQSLSRFVEQTTPATPISLYLGLSQDPHTLGFKGENYWIYSSLDHDDTYRRREEWVRELKPIQARVSFPSLKNRQAAGHTAEILTWTDINIFSKWRDQPQPLQDGTYQALKVTLTEALLNFVEQHLPGLTNLVVYKELSPLLTNQHSAKPHQRNVYGLPAIPERYRPEDLVWTRPTTVVPGLYLTGIDVHYLGVLGAMAGATFTLGELPHGISLSEIKSAAYARKKSPWHGR